MRQSRSRFWYGCALMTLLCLIGCTGETGSSTAPASLSLVDISPDGMAETAEPWLTVAPDGAVLMSYQRHEPVPAVEIRTLRNQLWSDSSSIVQSPDLMLNWADYPAVHALTDQHWIAHWLHKVPGDVYAYHVYTSSTRNAGASWQPGQRLHADDSATEHGFVSLHGDPDEHGYFWLDGQRYAQNDPVMQLHHRVAGQNETVVDTRVCDCCQTAAAQTSSGPVVAYRDRSSEEIRDISLARLTPEGWSTTTVAHDGWKISGCPVNGPAIAARDTASDELAVAWFTGSPEPTVRLAFSQNGGQTFAPALNLNSSATVGRVDVAWIDQARVAVTWLSDNNMLVMRIVDAEGNLSPLYEVLPTSTTRGAGFPHLLYHNSILYFAWTDTSATDKQVRVAVAKLP